MWSLLVVLHSGPLLQLKNAQLVGLQLHLHPLDFHHLLACVNENQLEYDCQLILKLNKYLPVHSVMPDNANICMPPGLYTKSCCIIVCRHSLKDVGEPFW